MRLAGRGALVTGAQQGIGRAIALAFAREGAAVAVNWLDDEAGASATVEAIRAGGGRARAVRGDVRDAADVARMVEAAEGLGGLDVLVNNAAIFPRVAFLEMCAADFDEVLAVNLRGTFLCAHAAATRMAARGRGAILNLSSRAAWVGSPRGAHYVTSKAGVIGLTRALALELAPHGIRVNAIAPGLTDTAQPRHGMSEEEIADAGRRTPLGRIATPEDIASAAVFLASDEAAHVTGQVLHVNGGQFLG